jgi:hypothetical protein
MERKGRRRRRRYADILATTAIATNGPLGFASAQVGRHVNN